MNAPYVRTGYEAIVPVRVKGNFTTIAEDDGVVKKVTKTSIEVEYKKLGKVSYKLKEWTTKEESGAVYTHKIVANLMPGSKFVKDDTLAYDKMFFEPDVFNPNRVIYRMSTNINVAIMEDPQTYEDSAAISRKLHNALATTVTKVKSVVLKAGDHITGMVKRGDAITPNDILFTFTDAATGDLSKMDNRTREILSNLKNNSPKAKYKGSISKVICYYNCEEEEMSESIANLVKETDKTMKHDNGYTGKVNSSYSIQGKPLMPGEVEIKIYINVGENMGIGDKAVLANQLKFTVGEVMDYDITNETGIEVDSVFANLSIQKRIVNSVFLMGTTGMVLDLVGKKACDIYFN